MQGKHNSITLRKSGSGLHRRLSLGISRANFEGRIGALLRWGKRFAMCASEKVRTNGCSLCKKRRVREEASIDLGFMEGLGLILWVIRNTKMVIGELIWLDRGHGPVRFCG